METLTPVPVTDFFKVRRAARDGAKYILSQILAGRFEFFRIGQCYFVTTAEHYDDGKQLVVVCCEGKGLSKAAKVLRTAAKNNGFSSVRIHAFSKGIVKILRAHDFKEQETVYKLEL